MKFTVILCSALWCAGLSMNACAASNQHVQSPAFNGQWENQMGSGMILTVQKGVVSGQYFTNVGAPDLGKKFGIIGQVEGDQIVFFVNFKGFGSMTAWVGQLTIRDGQEILRTQWHNTKDIPDSNEADEIWASVRTGGSDFVRTIDD